MASLWGCGFETVGPNEALVITGLCHSPSTIVSSTKVFLWPLQQAQRLDKNTFTVALDSQHVLTLLGIAVDVHAVAQLKLASDQQGLFLAAQNFASKRPAEIKNLVRETLEAHQRSIVGTLTVEELISDKDKLARAVETIAVRDLQRMGLQLVSYVITAIEDQGGYLELLGRSRTAEVKAAARIAEAESARDTLIQQNHNAVPRLEAQYQTRTAEQRGERDLLLRQCANMQRLGHQQAESELAAPLQRALREQEIMAANMDVKVRETERRVDLAVQETRRRTRELESTVRQPADAQAASMRSMASAQRNRTVMEAEAEAVTIRSKAEAEGYAVQETGRAQAAAAAKKAEAWEHYGSAAVLDMAYRILPMVVGEVAGQLEHTQRIAVAGNAVGVAAVPRDLARVAGQAAGLLQDLTALPVAQAVEAAVQGRGQAHGGSVAGST